MTTAMETSGKDCFKQLQKFDDKPALNGHTNTCLSEQGKILLDKSAEAGIKHLAKNGVISKHEVVGQKRQRDEANELENPLKIPCLGLDTKQSSTDKDENGSDSDKLFSKSSDQSSKADFRVTGACNGDTRSELDDVDSVAKTEEIKPCSLANTSGNDSNPCSKVSEKEDIKCSIEENSDVITTKSSEETLIDIPNINTECDESTKMLPNVEGRENKTSGDLQLQSSSKLADEDHSVGNDSVLNSSKRDETVDCVSKTISTSLSQTQESKDCSSDGDEDRMERLCDINASQVNSIDSDKNKSTSKFLLQDKLKDSFGGLLKTAVNNMETRTSNLHENLSLETDCTLPKKITETVLVDKGNVFENICKDICPTDNKDTADSLEEKLLVIDKAHSANVSEELHSESSSKKASCKEETSVSSTTMGQNLSKAATTMGQKLSKGFQNSTESVTMNTSEIKSNDFVDVKENEVEVSKCESVSYDEICDKDMGEKLVYHTNSSETGISEKDPSTVQENISDTLASENILDEERIVDEKNLNLNDEENMNDSITDNLKNKENVSPSAPEQEMEVDDAAILDDKKQDQVIEKFQDDKIKVEENQLLKADLDDTEILDIDDSVLDKGNDDDKETEAEKLGKQTLSISVNGIKKIDASSVKIEFDSKSELDEKQAKMETNACTSKEEYIDLDDSEADADLSKDEKSEIVKNNCEKAEDVQTHNGNVEDETELMSEAEEDAPNSLMRKRYLSGSPTPVAKKTRLDELLANLSERTGSPKDLSPEAESSSATDTSDDESEPDREKKMVKISAVDLKTMLRLKMRHFKTTDSAPIKKNIDEMQKMMSIFETSLKGIENRISQTSTSWLKRIGRKQAAKRKEKQLAAKAAQEASTVGKSQAAQAASTVSKSQAAQAASTVGKSQAAQAASTVGKSQAVSQNAQHVSESLMVTTVNQQRISNTLPVTQLATIATSLATSQPATFVSIPGSQNVALIAQQQLQAIQTAPILQKPRTTLPAKGSTVREMLETQRQQNGPTSASAKKGRMTIDLTEEDEASPRKQGRLSLVQQQGQTTLASIQPAANIRPGTVLLQGTPSSAGAVLLGVQGVRAPTVVYTSQPSIVRGQLVTVQRPPPPLQPSPNAMTLKNPPKAVASSTAQHPAPSSSPDLIVTKCDIPAPGTCHPAPLPKLPSNQPASPGMKSLPPKPGLKISRVQQGIVLSWNMTLSDQHAQITNYELYAYQEGSAPPTVNLWKKVGDVKALPLPMACTLTQFQVGNKYHFAVRAKDHHSRVGSFSDACSIHLQ